MTEPTIICPSCKTEIKLTESLAAPLIESTRQRVEAIVEAFSTMQTDLDKEKTVITKQWAKREEQINRVMQAAVGMYGNLQGIAGKKLQEIEGLDLLALDAPSGKEDESIET